MSGTERMHRPSASDSEDPVDNFVGFGNADSPADDSDAIEAADDAADREPDDTIEGDPAAVEADTNPDSLSNLTADLKAIHERIKQARTEASGTDEELAVQLSGVNSSLGAASRLLSDVEASRRDDTTEEGSDDDTGDSRGPAPTAPASDETIEMRDDDPAPGTEDDPAPAAGTVETGGPEPELGHYEKKMEAGMSSLGRLIGRAMDRSVEDIKGVGGKAKEYAGKSLEWYAKQPWYKKVAAGVGLAVLAAIPNPTSGVAMTGLWVMSGLAGGSAAIGTYEKRRQIIMKKGYSETAARRWAMAQGVAVGTAIGSMRLWLPAAFETAGDVFSTAGADAVPELATSAAEAASAEVTAITDQLSEIPKNSLTEYYHKIIEATLETAKETADPVVRAEYIAQAKDDLMGLKSVIELSNEVSTLTKSAIEAGAPAEQVNLLQEQITTALERGNIEGANGGLSKLAELISPDAVYEASVNGLLEKATEYGINLDLSPYAQALMDSWESAVSHGDTEVANNVLEQLHEYVERVHELGGNWHAQMEVMSKFGLDNSTSSYIQGFETQFNMAVANGDMVEAKSILATMETYHDYVEYYTTQTNALIAEVQHNLGSNPAEYPIVITLDKELQAALLAGDFSLAEQKFAALDSHVDFLRETHNAIGPANPDAPPVSILGNEAATTVHPDEAPTAPPPTEVEPYVPSEEMGVADHLAHAVEKGDAFSQHGLWGGIENNLMQPGEILYEAFKDAGVYPTADLVAQINLALHEVLLENPELMKVLSESASITQTEGGKIVTHIADGSVLNLGEFFSNETLLNGLEQKFVNDPDFALLRDTFGNRLHMLTQSIFDTALGPQ